MSVQLLRPLLATLLFVAAATTLSAQPDPLSWPGIKLPDGKRFEFRLHFPDGSTPERPCPVALVFVDGKQGRREVWDTLAHFFWMQVPKERVGVVVPVAPEAGPFHLSGLEGVRYLVRSLRGKTRIAGNGLHAVGIGAGALSAFAAAKQWPHQFASITVAVPANAELPPDLPADPRYAHLRLVVLAPEAAGAAPAAWKERIGAWRERGWRAEWRACAEPNAEAAWDALRAVTAAPEIPEAEVPIHDCLDRWHSAAACADQERYWSLWHADGVFLPPGSIDRWTLAQLRERAAAAFARPPGWVLVPAQRWIRLADDGKSAWVEESLGCFEHGAGRGLALMTKGEREWRVLRYALTGLPEGSVPGGKE